MSFSAHFSVGAATVFAGDFPRQIFMTIKLLTWKDILSWMRFRAHHLFHLRREIFFQLRQEHLFSREKKSINADRLRLQEIPFGAWNEIQRAGKLSQNLNSACNDMSQGEQAEITPQIIHFCLFSEAASPLFLLLLVFVSLLPKQIIVDYFFRFTCPLATTADSYLVCLKTIRLKQAQNCWLLNLTHGIITIILLTIVRRKIKDTNAKVSCFKGLRPFREICMGGSGQEIMFGQFLQAHYNFTPWRLSLVTYFAPFS